MLWDSLIANKLITQGFRCKTHKKYTKKPAEPRELFKFFKKKPQLH